MMVSVDSLSRLRAQTNPSTRDGDESGLPSTPSPPQNPSVRPLASPMILPHEFGSIGKESGAIALALRRLSLENQTDKAAQLVVPLADAAFDPQKLNNERTFNGCVSSVQGEGLPQGPSLRGLRPMLCKCAPRRRSDHSDSAYP